jgi:uncharacterized protein
VIVVTDTSVILNLCLIRQENLLTTLFERVLAPHQVVAEFQRLATIDQRFKGLVFPSFIQKAEPIIKLTGLSHSSRLHAGEIAALTLAFQYKASAILMDEKAGRSAAAALGLKTVGLLGILIEARQRSLIPSVSPLLSQLQNEGRFWIAPSLRREVLLAAGEIE